MQFIDGLPGPDFFILGAPKSGTTSLCAYLGEHPNIYFCTPKEPYFFCDDLLLARFDGDVAEYLKLFESKNIETQLAGEGSTWYLFSETAVENILNFRANAKLIVMLRNPVDMVQSLHSQFVFNMMEDEENFEKAWETHKMQPKAAVMHYEKVCMLGQQVERLIKRVPQEQLKIILFEDFKNDARKVHADVIKFLRLPFVELQQYNVANKNKRLRSTALAKFLQETPKPIVQLLNGTKKILGIRELGIAKSFEAINQKELSREPISADLKSELTEAFRDDILLLSDLLNRDLSHWVN